jgi:hypothetical protein
MRGNPTPFHSCRSQPHLPRWLRGECQREQYRNSSRACSFWPICAERMVVASIPPQRPVRAPSFLCEAPAYSIPSSLSILLGYPRGGEHRSLKWSCFGGLARSATNRGLGTSYYLEFTQPYSAGVFKLKDDSNPHSSRRVFMPSRRAGYIGQCCNRLSFRNDCGASECDHVVTIVYSPQTRSDLRKLILESIRSGASLRNCVGCKCPYMHTFGG